MNKNATGFYKVGDRVFIEKIEAVLYSSQIKERIYWDFNDASWSAIDWSIEPATSLPELYKLRAQQLRDHYDYIIVFFSGGADSTQVVQSFLKNDIKLDEIYAAAPVKAIENTKFNINDKSEFNVVAETFFTQIPFLKTINQKYPDIKVTLNDYSEDILLYNEDDWILKCSDWIHPTTIARYSLEKFHHIKELIEKGKKVAAVYGNAKPIPLIENNEFYNMFADVTINVARPGFDNLPLDLVSFYTSIDFPLIPIKQGHELLRSYNTNQDIKSLIDTFMINMNTTPGEFRPYKGERWHGGTLERGIVPVIYPDLNYTGWQGGKGTRCILAEHDAWFYKDFKNHKIYQMMISEISNFTKNLGIKYFKDVSREHLVTFRKRYKIGNVKKET